jgi:ATPase subunit of ABC transporter with duplicated ATPase domains
MSATLTARDLALTYARVPILDGVDISVVPGRRIGLLGPNGVGKSTLLRVLAGLVRPDRGTVESMPPRALIGYLPQEHERRDGELVEAFVARRTGVAAAEVELTASTAELASGSADAADRYDVALERWLALGAADLEARTGEVWASLGLSPRLLGQPMTTLSGGEAARVGLAALLLSRFDVYLLDEPTNDVDLVGLARLESWLTGLSAGVVLVSHDRTFLANVVTHIVELDEFTRRSTQFAGGWEAYLTERERARQHAWERFDEYDTQRKGLAQRAQREREWATQGLSAAKKKPDDGDKNIKAFKVNQTEKLAGRAARTDRAMERLEVVDKPRESWQLRLTINEAPRSGAIVARLDDVVVERGTFTLGPISLTIGVGERIAIVGSNGAGKSTLLGAILERTGPSVVVAEITQARTRFASDRTVLDIVQRASGMTTSDTRTLLAKFGLVAAHVDRPAISMSPGERTRATLAMLMAVGTNCLVLDEPTNHLDLPAIEQLEQALETFGGTVLLVTHDRSLLEHVRLTRRLELTDGQITADIPLG